MSNDRPVIFVGGPLDGKIHRVPNGTHRQSAARPQPLTVWPVEDDMSILPGLEVDEYHITPVPFGFSETLHVGQLRNDRPLGHAELLRALLRPAVADILNGRAHGETWR